MGEIVARGANVTPGYWQRPGETAAALRGGWLRTGDLARIDKDGYVHLVGRTKDMLVSGGLNVYPREVELRLEEHPAIREAAVVGAADERWGEVPVAFLVVANDAPPNLPSDVAGFLSSAWLGTRCRSATSLLPHSLGNSNGKLVKRTLRERAAAGETQAES